MRITVIPNRQAAGVDAAIAAVKQALEDRGATVQMPADGYRQISRQGLRAAA